MPDHPVEPISDVARPVARTVRIAARDRRPVIALIAIGAFLAVAIVKPWAGTAGDRPATTGRAIVTMPAAASGPASAVIPGSDAAERIRAHCQDPLGWRVYSREQWTDSAVRVWRRLEPADRASGPLDPTLPVVEVGPDVSAVGYCSPWTGIERPPDGASVTAWWIDRQGANPIARPLELRSVAPSAPNVLGVLYGPANAPGARPAGPVAHWSPGRFVFVVGGTDFTRWWAVDVLPGSLARVPASGTPTQP